MSNSSEKCSCTSFEHDILSNQNNIDLFCSYLSHLSYHSQDFIKNILQHINPLYIKFYDASEKQGFYLETQYYIFFVFRGTDDALTDFKNDLKFWKTSYKDYDVHTGFFNAFQKVRYQLDTDLSYANTCGKHIIYCGHSMGGALATILCLDILPHSLITFGCPRVSSGQNFIDLLSTINSRRYVNKGDIVSGLPQYFLGYTHHCRNIILTSNFGNVFKSHYSTNYVLAMREMIK